MTWTPEKLQQIPEIYRDFMLTLKPVIDSRDHHVVLKINGIPFGMIFDFITSKHPLNVEQIHQLAHNLEVQDYIHRDELGFYTPTPKGEDLILALNGVDSEVASQVPPLPQF